MAPAGEKGQYLQLVISASYDLLQKPRQEIIDLCLKEVRQFLPAAREAKLVKATVIKEAAATFSPQPGRGSAASKTRDADWADVPCGGLDGHGLARHDGRCGAERLPGRGSAAAKGWNAKATLAGGFAVRRFSPHVVLDGGIIRRSLVEGT